MADVAVAFGVEILSRVSGPLGMMGEDWLLDTGLNLPGWYALKASDQMHRYGVTAEDLAAIVVKSRRFAAHNPFAHFRDPVTVEEVLGSRMIAEPLTLFQCCPKVDGASAAIVCSEAAVKRLGLRPTWLRGIALVSGTHVYTDQTSDANATQRAARAAYEEAAVGPEDIQVLECHDAFSIGEVVYTEDLGVFPRGEGARRAVTGETSIGGHGPVVNPSGGLLSKGHPLGATGTGQIAEIVWQLRGEAGGRQVDNARIGLVHTNGASEFELDANACCVAVLEKG